MLNIYHGHYEYIVNNIFKSRGKDKTVPHKKSDDCGNGGDFK